MLKIKNTITEMKNAFNGFITRLDMADERIFDVEDISIETSKSEKLREKKKKTGKENRISTNYEKAT